MFRVRLAKENFKFSASHFTIFSESEAERLHGHNYYVTLIFDFKDWNDESAMTADFSTLKEPVKNLCATLDEKILIAQDSPHLKVTSEGPGTWVNFHQKRYFFPNEDLCLLPLTNITCEALAFFLSGKLQHHFSEIENITKVEVEVTETRGQSSSYICDFSATGKTEAVQ